MIRPSLPCTTCLQTTSCFLWLAVFSPNANTYPLGSLLTNRNFPHSEKAEKHIFMGLSGRRSLSPRVSPSYFPRFFLAPRTFKRLPRRLRIDRSPSRSLFCQFCNIFVFLLVSSSDPCPPGLILHASAQFCQGKRFVYTSV